METSFDQIIALDTLAFLGILSALLYAGWMHQVRTREDHGEKLVGDGQEPALDQMKRKPGEWQPQSFKYPPISPWSNFDFQKTLPPPYRPFRWGPKYNVTMGIRSMDFNEWIEIDNRYAHYHAIRTQRTETGGTDTVRTMPTNEELGVPGGQLAARELVNELGEFLTRRYPHVFCVVSRVVYVPGDFSWDELGEIEVIEIAPLKVKYNLQQEDPMKISGLLVQDDLALMLEGRDSRYYFQAGSICTAGFWRLRDKIGCSLERIHEGGGVPQYREKLRDSMNRFFTKLRADKPVVRNNYFFQIVRRDDDPARLGSTDADELAWSDSTNGHENYFDEFTHAPEPEFAETSKFVTPQPISRSEVGRVYLRTERQSLRRRVFLIGLPKFEPDAIISCRLPRSGAIVFTIRTYVEPITKLAKEPGVPGRLAAAIRSWPPDIAESKGQHLYKDAVLDLMDQCHTQQIEGGLVHEEQRHTDYPF